MEKRTDHFTCDAVLLDLDGVLIDSTSSVRRAWERFAAKHSLELERIMHTAHGKRAIDTMRAFAPHLDLEAEAHEFSRWEIDNMDGVFAIPGARRLMETLPAERWAIVTSADDALARARLSAAGLPAPSRMITADLVQRGKPDPQAYLLGSRLIQVPPEGCLVIEDAPAGIHAGKAAGMRVLGVPTTHDPDELSEADAVIPSIQSLDVLPAAKPGAFFTLQITG